MKCEREQLDTSIDIITPENIEFSYRLAGPFRRAPAFLLDILIQIAICVLMFIVLLLIAAFFRIDFIGYPLGFFFAGIFFLFVFYGAYFEATMNGQSPGKRLMGLRVLTIDGQPINKFQAVLRNLIRIADMMPFAFIPVPVPLAVCGLASMTISNRFQRLGDIAAGTMVVVEDSPHNRRDLVRFQHKDVMRMAEWFPPNLQINPHQAKAIALYVHRRKSLSMRRREDIAIYLSAPLQEMYGLDQVVNPDLFLCALYHKCLSKAE